MSFSPLASTYIQYIYKPVSCITSFLSYCGKHVVSTSFPRRNHKNNLDRYSSVAGPKHVRNSSNTVPPRLALQSKWPKASSNIEERKDVCAFRFNRNHGNHLPFLYVPLYSLYFPWISVLHRIHVDCWGFLFGWAVGHTLVPLELYKRERCRKPLYNGLYLHIIYMIICLYNTRHCRICPSLPCKVDLQVTHQN